MHSTMFFSQWIFHENDFKLSQTMWYVSLRPSTEDKGNLGKYYPLTFFSISYIWFPDALYSGISKLKKCMIHSNNCTREQRGATLPANMLLSLDSLRHSHPISWNRNRNHWWLNQMGQRPISSPSCFLCLTDRMNASHWDRKIIQHLTKAVWRTHMRVWVGVIEYYIKCSILTCCWQLLCRTQIPIQNHSHNPCVLLEVSSKFGILNSHPPAVNMWGSDGWARTHWLYKVHLHPTEVFTAIPHALIPWLRICTSMSHRTKQRKLLSSGNKYMQI